MSNSSIWPIERILLSATTPDWSELGSDGNKVVLCILQNSSITGTSRSNCFLSYPGHSLGSLTPQQRCSWFIQLLQLTKRIILCKKIYLQLTIINTNNLHFGRMSSVFPNDLGEQGSIPGRVIPKTQKMVLDAALFNTRHYKVWIKDKVEHSREWSSTFPYTSV